ncbi:HAMP domain-containing protein [Halapricum sp. CBA1109]|uniref:methyl-accepting chemotaxis protein n=1 Tax=Halapricum sp. CBA1109 TaxID=2668068 RepID=UPI0012F9E5D1|nr:methyl-accepting chemotaxis protein [Halapricum sp. CBA1109]MUV89360.1 HAMP domain-containing protein [Halapricum sp. CBA1109]
MIDRLRRSFPAKLIVVAALVLLVVGVYAGLTAAEASADVEAQAEETLRDDARQMADTTSVWLESVATDLDTVASSSAARSGDTAGVQSYLDGLQTNESGIVAIGYDGGDGTIAAATDSSVTGTALPDDMETGTVSKPFEVPFHDGQVVALSRAVEGGDGRAVAVLDMQAFVGSLGVHGDNAVVATGDRTIVSAPSSGRIGETHADTDGRIEALAGQADGTRFMTMEEMVMSFSALEEYGLVVMVHQDRAAAYGLTSTVRSALLGTIFMGLVGVVVIGATVGSSTVITLRQLTTRAEQMADGNLDVPLETRRDDEFGRLHASLAEMRDSLKTRIKETEEAREEAETAKREAESARQEAERERQEAEDYTDQLQSTAQEYADVMQAAAAGDLTQRLDTDGRSQAMADIGEEFNDMIGEIQETTQTVVRFAEDVAETAVSVEGQADEVQRATVDVADAIDEIQHGAREQDRSLEDVAREIENLSASAEEIAATTDDVAETSRETAEAALRGETAATDALDEMDSVVTSTAAAAETIQGLDEEMGRIGEIVDVIQNIAEETNMLALNASIEAARAGGGDGAGDGQGFAVVADEVKSLSEETKDSADQIESRIADVQEQTGEAVDAVTTAREQVQETAETVEDALTSLETIAERVDENDDSIQEISNVTSDQANSAQSASDKIAAVADISQRTVQQADGVADQADAQSESVDDVREAVTDLRGQADSLQQLLEQFTVTDGGLRSESTPTESASPDGGSEGGAF